MYLMEADQVELVKMCGAHQLMMDEESDQYVRGNQLEIQSPALKVRAVWY